MGRQTLLDSLPYDGYVAMCGTHVPMSVRTTPTCRSDSSRTRLPRAQYPRLSARQKASHRARNRYSWE